MHMLRLRPLVTSILMAMSLLGTVLVLSPLSSAFNASDCFVAGHVYILNNPAGPSSISAFNRFADGTLAFAGTTVIGGQESGSGLGDARAKLERLYPIKVLPADSAAAGTSVALR